MTKFIRTLFPTVAFVAAAGYAAAQSCYQVDKERSLTADELKSVVITAQTRTVDQQRFRKDFSLSNTLGKIIETASPTAKATEADKIALLASLTRSFRTSDQLNPDSGLRLRMPPRPGEASLDPIDLLADPEISSNKDAMIPIALFNRWDLAPGDYRYCGEHRIIYAKKKDDDFRRFFLIFEAGLDNPDPKNDKEGCRPVINFWRSLESKQGSELQDALRDFYFSGLDANKNGTPEFQPVVHHQHFGIPYGQIRGNLFVVRGHNVRWQLREWRTSLTADGFPTFVIDTVKQNPHAALFSSPAVDQEEPGFDGLRRVFVEQFLRDYVLDLTATERDRTKEKPVVTRNDLIEKLSSNFANRYNSFHSDAGGVDDPAERAEGTDLAKRVPGRLSDVTDAACQLTETHILNRAGLNTCGGCHQPQGLEIAPKILWPAPKPPGDPQAFVHVTETGLLSDALLNHFLPARHAKLKSEKFLATFPASAVLTTQSVRDAAARVSGAETRLQSIEALKDLESKVQVLRAQDASTPGAVTPNRRVH